MQGLVKWGFAELSGQTAAIFVTTILAAAILAAVALIPSLLTACSAVCWFS